jgi:lysophospholipase L1-like esterase
MDARDMALLGIAGVGLALAGTLSYALKRDVSPRVVACLGDSLSDKYGYPDDLIQYLPEGSMVKAYAYPGAGVAKIHDHLSSALGIMPTDLVVLVGVNDLASGRDPEHVIRHLGQMYLEAQEEGVRVIGVALTPWTGHYRGLENFTATQYINNWIVNLSTADRVVSTAALGDLSGYLYQEFDAGDGLHLNKQGFAALAQLVSGAF